MKSLHKQPNYKSKHLQIIYLSWLDHVKLKSRGRILEDRFWFAFDLRWTSAKFISLWSNFWCELLCNCQFYSAWILCWFWAISHVGYLMLFFCCVIYLINFYITVWIKRFGGFNWCDMWMKLFNSVKTFWFRVKKGRSFN